MDDGTLLDSNAVNHSVLIPLEPDTDLWRSGQAPPAFFLGGNQL